MVTCRVENILTLGKLLSLWFCFLLHSVLFLTSQTSYHTYKIISSYELARPLMGTIILVYISREISIEHHSVGLSSLAQSREISIEHSSDGARFARPIRLITRISM